MDVEDMLVSIRRGLSEGAIRGVSPAALAAGARGRKRILVADDSITVREVERQMLSRLGHEVEVAVDGMDAWNQLRAGQFDMLVTDVDMPRMNGIELVRMVRSEARFASLPIAIVSYKDRAEDRAAGMDAGANAYLTKGSFQDQTFITTVNDLIGDSVS
jgi:two-component system sensor histidine kinase and response regulator WspE